MTDTQTLPADLPTALRADPDYERQRWAFAAAIARQPTPQSRRTVWAGLYATIADAYRRETDFSAGQRAVLLATWDQGVRDALQTLDQPAGRA
jgi:hypothetical protein